LVDALLLGAHGVFFDTSTSVDDSVIWSEVGIRWRQVAAPLVILVVVMGRLVFSGSARAARSRWLK